MSNLTRTLAVCAAISVALAGCTDSDPTADADSTESPTASQTSASAEELVAGECETWPDMPTGRIAYTQAFSDGTSAIYLMKPDGTDRRCLVDTPGSDLSPAWSPDGRWIAFTGGTDSSIGIYLVRADGTGPRRLKTVPGLEAEPVWSPDGQRIAYNVESGDDGPFSIHVMSRDGSGSTRIVSSGGDIEYVSLHDWSPDGQTMLVGVDQGGGIELWAVRPDGSDLRELRSAFGDFGSGATFSPDGRRVVFQADLNGGCIYVSDPNGRQLKRLTKGCVEGPAPDWSPNGEWIVWAGGGHGPGDAEVMRSDGSQRHVIADDSDVAYVAWQPR